MRRSLITIQTFSGSFYLNSLERRKKEKDSKGLWIVDDPHKKNRKQMQTTLSAGTSGTAFQKQIYIKPGFEQRSDNEIILNQAWWSVQKAD